MSWLARLKNLQTPEGHATKPTEPGFVGFVAPPLGVSENSGVVEVPLRLRQVGPANAAPAVNQHEVDVGRACGDFSIKLPELSQEPAHTPAQVLLDVAQAGALDDAAMARSQARAVHCRRLGFTADEAAGLAQQLHERDVHADYRHLCCECRHYRRGRCGNHGAAGLATNIVGRELAVMLQHCAGFAEVVS